MITFETTIQIQCQFSKKSQNYMLHPDCEPRSHRGRKGLGLRVRVCQSRS